MLCGYPPDPNVFLHGPGVGAGVAVAQTTQCLGEGQRFGNRLSQLLLSEPRTNRFSPGRVRVEVASRDSPGGSVLFRCLGVVSGVAEPLHRLGPAAGLFNRSSQFRPCKRRSHRRTHVRSAVGRPKSWGARIRTGIRGSKGPCLAWLDDSPAGCVDLTLAIRSGIYSATRIVA